MSPPVGEELIECVPNFSEGRSTEVINAISAAISSIPNVKLLDVDPGPSTNRTVYTFVGPAKAVVDAALAAARVARKRIDMAVQHGEHPRMGTLDVCPFVPLSNAPEAMKQCIQCARDFGRRLAEELAVPVYLYCEAVDASDASKSHRRTLPQIRTGEYEGLPSKLKQAEWKPDFGPAEFVPAWGATVTGARKFLIAYNLNVLGTKEQAHRIALNIREQGRGPNEPGRLKKLQAIGWYLDEHKIAQISTNILDFEVTPIWRVFEECRRDATDLGVALAGSEIVGLVPLQAFLDCAEQIMQDEQIFVLDEADKIRLVVNRLGLSTLRPFDADKRIIEYLAGWSPSKVSGPLASLTVADFVRKVASRTPTPGGGSVAALVGALGCALATMGAQLTYGQRKFENVDANIRRLLPKLHAGVEACLPLIDADTDAFDGYVKSLKDGTHEQQDAAAQTAAMVPLRLIKNLRSYWPSLIELAGIANPACLSDVEVAAFCLNAAIRGARCNVDINLPNLSDKLRASVGVGMATEAAAAVDEATEGLAGVMAVCVKRSSKQSNGHH